MLAAGFPDIKAQFEIELGALLKHEQRSTCLFGASLIYFIFCLAVRPLWGLPPVPRIHAQPWFLTAQLAEGAPPALLKSASSWACSGRLPSQCCHYWL